MTRLTLLQMKINYTLGKKIQAALLGAVLLGAGAARTQAALPFPPSPIFTNGVPAWDCLVTGIKGERGIMFFTFTYAPDGYGNYIFTNRLIHTKVPASIAKVPVTITNTPDAGRGGSSSGRGGSSGNPVTNTNLADAAATTAGTNIFGYLKTTGSWGYDYKGNILGFYVELVLDKPGEGTNPPTFFTNAVSFIGKVTPNKRFTALYSSSIGGNGKYAGVPLKTVTNHVNGSDFSGPWTGDEIVGSRDMVELFSMTNAGFPNSYNIIGDGPSYTLDAPGATSKCLVSCQKKIAFTDYKFITLTNIPYLRATFGPLQNTTKVAGSNTKGLLTGSNVVYNAYFVPFVPYP